MEEHIQAGRHSDEQFQPKDSLAGEHLQAGEELLARGEWEEAQKKFEEALALDATNPVIYNKIGVTFAKRKIFAEAKEYFEKALALDPGFATAYNNLGNIYNEQKLFEEAVAAYKQALAINPDHASANHNLGVVYKRMGDLGKAVPLLKKAVRLEREQLKVEVKARRNKPINYLIWGLGIVAAIYLLFLLKR
ncbi:MAG: tetratricopeptide repeat protein [Syntrophothermus sp.]